MGKNKGGSVSVCSPGIHDRVVNDKNHLDIDVWFCHFVEGLEIEEFRMFPIDDYVDGYCKGYKGGKTYPTSHTKATTFTTDSTTLDFFAYYTALSEDAQEVLEDRKLPTCPPPSIEDEGGYQVIDQESAYQPTPPTPSKPEHVASQICFPPQTSEVVTNAASGSTALGSDSWIGADATQSDDAFHQRASVFVAAVKWDALLSISSRVCHGIPCKVSDEFPVSHFNMVRRIVFDDRVSWVVRLRMPPIADVPADREDASVARIMQVELAGMKFLRAKTDIPVPKVHSYNTEQDNDVVAPYILMGYIHGNGLCPRPLRHSEQDRSFRREMAMIQAVLATFTFDRIGSLYQDPATEEFFVGLDIETDKALRHSLRVCVNNAAPEVLTSASFALPVIFTDLMKRSGGSDGNSRNGHSVPFCLTNRNLLVDEEFQIVEVIDLDGIMAAAYEVAAQFSVLAGLDPEPPGHVETKPMALERITRTEPLIREYNGKVKEIGEGADSRGRKI
ncbi:hypothetical protein EDB80DRAFT_676926 [Ilyonectria destructans]|nr:hypothetical protein EDB80DRAFT_676926 [Ilyonectria destructans]